MTRPYSTPAESSVERFFLRRPLQLANVGRDAVELDGSEAHHLLHVLRAKVGDQVGLFNGDGDEALAEIVHVGKRSAELRLLQTWTAPFDTHELTLAVTLPKGDRARWLIEKATELGVTRVLPLQTARSVVEPGAGKLDKLEQTVVAACKQCGRSRLLQIGPLTSLERLLLDLASPVNEPLVKWIAHPQATMSISVALSQFVRTPGGIIAVVGPEGGFTDEEFSQSIATGIRPIALGPQVLRIETAALVIAASCRLACGRTG